MYMKECDSFEEENRLILNSLRIIDWLLYNILQTCEEDRNLSKSPFA